MIITTTNNSVIIKEGVQTIAGNTGTFGYTYSLPTDSVTITKDGKLVATGALSNSSINGEALTPDNIDEKLNPIFLTFSGGGVDLSNYYTKAETDELLNGKLDKDKQNYLIFNSITDRDNYEHLRNGIIATVNGNKQLIEDWGTVSGRLYIDTAFAETNVGAGDIIFYFVDSQNNYPVVFHYTDNGMGEELESVYVDSPTKKYIYQNNVWIKDYIDVVGETQIYSNIAQPYLYTETEQITYIYNIDRWVIFSANNKGAVGRKVINVADTKIRLDADYDLLYVWDFNDNVPFTSFTMEEDEATKTLSTTNSATIVLKFTGSSSSSITITFPKNLVWSTDADAKYYINTVKATGSEAGVTSFQLKGNEMKVINIYGLGDKRIMEIDY